MLKSTERQAFSKGIYGDAATTDWRSPSRMDVHDPLEISLLEKPSVTEAVEFSWAELQDFEGYIFLLTWLDEQYRRKTAAPHSWSYARANLVTSTPERVRRLYTLDPNFAKCSRNRKFFRVSLPELAATQRPTYEIRTDFRPSEKLIAFVQDAISVYQSSASTEWVLPTDLPGFDSEKFWEPPGAEEIRRDLTSFVKQLLMTLGQRAKYEAMQELPLSNNGRFVFAVQQEVRAAIPLVPDETGPFIQQLREDLIPVARSERFGGQWGVLALDSNDDLFLKINVEPKQGHVERVARRKIKYRGRN